MPKATTIIGWGQRLGAVGVGVLALAVVHYVYSAQKKADAAEAAFWSLDGPPCPTMDTATYARSGGEPKMTAYGGARFEYRVGHMMCALRPDTRGSGEHPVCQFTGPVLLGVKTAGTQAYFAPAGMSAVRVAVIDGTARCVLIDHFEMKDHR
jgi:cbb3-type cytochrome oxidase subunit 3